MFLVGKIAVPSWLPFSTFRPFIRNGSRKQASCFIYCRPCS